MLPSAITNGGLFHPATRTVRWGPFSDTTARTFSYAATGRAGIYDVRGAWSVDGYGTLEPAPRSVTVAESGAPAPNGPPPVVARPTFSPNGSVTLPADVTLACATSGATIRYTTDGTAPNETSAMYAGSLHLAAETMLRARGFKTGMTPSAAGAALFQQVDFGIALSVVRTIAGSGGVLPAVTLNATPASGLASFTVTEELPPGLQPYDIDMGGVWTASKRTVKWGPFSGASAVSLHYNVSGDSGSYALDGEASRDGRPQAITGSTAVVVDLSTIQQVATPQFSPPANGVFPVDVTLACATPGAVIRYTIDGPAADESSPIYTAPLHLITAATVRAKAFKQFMAPSAAVTRRYGEDMLPAGTIILRTITANHTTTPDIRLAVTPVAEARCYTITEELPEGLAAQGISHGGKFDAASRTVNWGPFLDHAPRTLTYAVSGANGEYALDGSGSFNGFAVPADGDVYLTIVSSALVNHAVTGNWTFAPQVALTVAPVNLGGGEYGEPVHTYTVEEFLPTGVTPTGIDNGGIWNAGLRAIKWGPFQDAQVRTFHYQPSGAYQVFESSSRISVDGVSVLSVGETPVILGLPAPANLLAASGNQAVFLAWTPSGREAGYKVYFRTQAAPTPEQVLNIGPAASGIYSLGGLTNGTQYWIAMTAYDAAGVESARSATVMATPTASAGTWGTVAFDQAVYPAVTDHALVTVWDADLNTNPATLETVSVQVVSDTDATGISVTLKETGANTGVFTSLAGGADLGFTFGASVPATALLQVREGDEIRVTYTDALPTGTRLAYAQFAEFDSDSDGLPDWWEREQFGGYNIAGANTDHDRDGTLDGAEFIAGTNPNDPTSAFKIVSVARTTDNRITLRWTSVAGKTYTVEKSTALSGYYEVIAGLPSAGAFTEYTDVNPTGTMRIFYRVRVDQ